MVIYYKISNLHLSVKSQVFLNKTKQLSYPQTDLNLHHNHRNVKLRAVSSFDLYSEGNKSCL